MERISCTTPLNERYGHEFRYHVAAGFIQHGDVILDAACGIGYGAEILTARGGVMYVGVDKDITEVYLPTCENLNFIQIDLMYYYPSFKYDIFVGFETIEHLADYTHYIEIAKKARRLMFLSVPVIPTKHKNPYHLHDFEPGSLPGLIEDENWYLFQGVGQPSEFSEIYVFKRR